MPKVLATTSSALTAFDSAQDDDQMKNAFFEFEEEVARNGFSVQSWSNYIVEARARNKSDAFVFGLYERALQVLPRSYKLWKQYLDALKLRVRSKRIDSLDHLQLVQKYEQALTQLNKMPRIWLDFLALLQEMQRVTLCRKAFDRALRALPLTQHNRIWAKYLEFVQEINIPLLAVRVYRRYLMFDPAKREEYVDYLLSIDHFEEASKQIVILINNYDSQVTKRTLHGLWMQLCDLVSQHPDDVDRELNIEAILRSGIRQFTDEVGRLWCSLATYFVRLGLFGAARDIYEEAMQRVLTVRDFSMIFDAYVKFLEAMVTTEMELASSSSSASVSGNGSSQEQSSQVDRLLRIYEDVADRRPLLLNSVLLRQNPNLVKEWEKRVELLQSASSSESEIAQQVIRTYAAAVQAVDPLKSGGRLHVLWVKFAQFYEKHDDLDNARAIFKKATQVNYKNDDELASIYCEWAEMELRAEDFDASLEIVRKATKLPSGGMLRKRTKNEKLLSAQQRVYKNVKLWSLRLDLEESLGTMDSTRKAYGEAFDLQIITVQMILNFASYLEENKYFEESFRVYERGLGLFPQFPHAKELWIKYLTQFVKRYGGSKLERARDLHEQAVTAAPREDVKVFFELFAAFEEKHGMHRNVMAIYDRATQEVAQEHQLDVFLTYVKKAQKYFGVTKVREVYERGVMLLKEDDVPTLSLNFASMETKLGEIDRARAIYAHASQFCDPRRTEESFWKKWHEFEVSFGSEHTFLEMLRIKRSVTAQYSHVNYLASDALAAEEAKKVETETAKASGSVPSIMTSSAAPSSDPMEQLEGTIASSNDLKRKAPPSRDANDEPLSPATKKPIHSAVVVANEEEIDLDDEDDDEEEQDSVQVEQKELPATLFQSGE